MAIDLSAVMAGAFAGCARAVVDQLGADASGGATTITVVRRLTDAVDLDSLSRQTVRRTVTVRAVRSAPTPAVAGAGASGGGVPVEEHTYLVALADWRAAAAAEGLTGPPRRDDLVGDDGLRGDGGKSVLTVVDVAEQVGGAMLAIRCRQERVARRSGSA